MTTHTSPMNRYRCWLCQYRWPVGLFMLAMLVAITLAACGHSRAVETDLGENIEIDATRRARAHIMNPEIHERFAAELDFLRTQLRIPGLSAGIVKDGELIWADGFGLADLENEIPATPATPYGLASVTKPFAAFLLMRLVEQGKLDLDTPVSEFGIYIDGDGLITVRHLLSHTSEDVPGTRYAYSGGRYSQLTRVIAQLYGASFRDVLRDEILLPLDMSNTVLNHGSHVLEYYIDTLAPDDPEQAFVHVYHEAAVPYQYDRFYNTYPASTPTYANTAAGLISSVEDLAKFAAAIEDDVLVSPATKAEMFAPTLLHSGTAGPYGLGWFSEVVDGRELIWHYGYGAYSTLFLMVPSEGLTFIALANSQNLSRPFQLGLEGISVLGSPVGLAFYKEFILEGRYADQLPADWRAGKDAVAESLRSIEDPRAQRLAEHELWLMRKLYAGVGDTSAAHQLLMAHMMAFPEDTQSAMDLYQVERPGAQPEPIERAELRADELARWVGAYALREEDHSSGLPLGVTITLYGNRLILEPTDDASQEFIPIRPTELVTPSNPDLILEGDGADGPFQAVIVTYSGQPVGTYERLQGDSDDDAGE